MTTRVISQRAATVHFDWSTLHVLLEAIPEGRWTSYGSLADAIGPAAQPLGQHLTKCRQCVNPHRILNRDGTVAANFAGHAPNQRTPMDLLRSKGVSFDGDVADGERELTTEELVALIED